MAASDSAQRLTEARQKGILYIVISALGFALMSFFVKASGDIPVMEKAVFRNLVASFAAFLLLKRSGHPFRIGKGNYLAMLLRCSFGTAGLIANFWAISHLKIGDANILSKMAPFFSIVMSIMVLGEKPNGIELLSVFLALIGAAFVVKPGSGVASAPALVALFGGLCAGSAYTFVRKLGTHGVQGPVIVLCFSVFSTLVCLPFTILSFVPISIGQLLCLIAAGCAAALAQIAVTAAYTYAPAKDISVFDYTQVLFASMLGFVFFHEIPDIYSIIGYIIIIGTAIGKWYYALNKA